MILIGLAGRARSGKDTVADYLELAYGFKKFSFSDALYEEVSEAFQVNVEFLQSAATKEAMTRLLEIDRSLDAGFYITMKRLGWESLAARSPREILQAWGTEYRRAQDPDYWVKQANSWVRAYKGLHPTVMLVNTSVRYPNEAEWVGKNGGKVWSLIRPQAHMVTPHSSEATLHQDLINRYIRNDSDFSGLYRVVDRAVINLLDAEVAHV